MVSKIIGEWTEKMVEDTIRDHAHEIVEMILETDEQYEDFIMGRTTYLIRCEYDEETKEYVSTVELGG